MSRCYSCDRPTDDWQEPCVCGSRAFYRGEKPGTRMPATAPGPEPRPEPSVIAQFFAPERSMRMPYPILSMANRGNQWHRKGH